MKKIQAMMLGMLAVFASGAVFAATASAENTLPAQWLANGVAVAGALNTESSGELLLEDVGAASAVLCSGILDGTVNTGGKDTTTEVLNLKGEKIELGLRALLGTGAGSDCVTVKGCAEGSAASPIEVYPVGLPWTTTLFLHETTEAFLDLISATEVGYELVCLVLGLKVEDKCTTADTEVEIVNGAEGAEVPAGAIAEPFSNCSIGGATQGKNQADALALIKLVGSTETLTVSE